VSRFRFAALTGVAGLAAVAGVMLVPLAASAQTTATDPVTLTLGPLPSALPLNSPVTLAGTATYATGNTSHPLADAPLTITAKNGGVPPATATTKTDGSFSYATTMPLSDSQCWTVSSAATATFGAAAATVCVNTLWPTQFGLVTANLSTRGTISLDGCVFLEAPQTSGTPLVGPIKYQYSARRAGPWKNLGTVKGVSNTYCPTTSGPGSPSWSFPAHFKAPLANGYYRAVYAGASNAQRAVSQVLHRWKNRTRITSFTVTPTSVRRDGMVTVSGRLWQLTSKWTGDPRQKIVVEFRYRHTTYVFAQRLTTGPAGRFRGTFRVPRSASWFALYNGDKSQFAVTTGAIVVSVR
jgi:hypothetical protein